MQILASANKPIEELTVDALEVPLDPKVSLIDIQGVSTERKNIIYEDDSDDSIQKLVDNLAKDGVLR